MIVARATQLTRPKNSEETRYFSRYTTLYRVSVAVRISLDETGCSKMRIHVIMEQT